MWYAGGMLRLYVAAAALLSAAPALAEEQGGFHLVIWGTKGGVTSIPYRSSASCERAKRAIKQDADARTAEARQKAEDQNSTLISMGSLPLAVCIPA